MSKARQQRLKEARSWYPEQHFTEDSHIIKAYRKRFNVDRICAMRELCLLGLLPPGKQKAYQENLEARGRKFKEKREAHRTKKESVDIDYSFQDETFYFIAGYTSGGAPYGVTWEEMIENEGAKEGTE